MQLLQHNRKTHHVFLKIGYLFYLHTFITCGIQLGFRILILHDCHDFHFVFRMR